MPTGQFNNRHAVKNSSAPGSLINLIVTPPYLYFYTVIFPYRYPMSNPIHGQILNPHDPAVTPGGSSSGEAALLAAGGSILGIGECYYILMCPSPVISGFSP